MGDAGSLLVRAGLVESAALEAARAARAAAGGTLAEQLVLAGAIDDETLTQFYRDRLLVPRVSDSRLRALRAPVIEKIPGDMAVELRVVPVSLDGEGSLTVAMSDPSDTHAVDELGFFSGHYVVRAVASQRQIAWCLAHYYGVITDLGRRLLDEQLEAASDPENLTTEPYLESREALDAARRRPGRITEQIEASRKRVIPPDTYPPIEDDEDDEDAEDDEDDEKAAALGDWERALQAAGGGARRQDGDADEMPDYLRRALDGKPPDEASMSGVIDSEARGPAAGGETGGEDEAVEIDVETFEIDAELPEPGEDGGRPFGSPPELAPRAGELEVHHGRAPSVGGGTPAVLLDEAQIYGDGAAGEGEGEGEEDAGLEISPDEQTDPTLPLAHLRWPASSQELQGEDAEPERQPAGKPPRHERGTDSAPFLLSEIKRRAQAGDEAAESEDMLAAATASGDNGEDSVLLLDVPKKRSKRRTSLGIGVPPAPGPSGPSGTSPPAAVQTIDWGDSTKLRRLVDGLEYEAARAPSERASSPAPELDDEGAAHLLDTLETIHSAGDRDAIVAAILDYLEGYCERVVFLALRGGALEPWQIRRETAPPEKPGARLPLRVLSIFRDIVDTRLPYRGPIEDEPSRGLIEAIFGSVGDGEGLAVPVAVRGRVVGLLYAGGIAAALENHHIGLVTQAAGRALERILRRKKTED